MFWDRGNARVLNSNSIEGLEAMDRPESFSVFLENTKPSRSIGGV
jgi:hypothetical protein